MDQEKTTSVFIAYSRKDIDFLTELRTFLRPLEQNKGVEIWYDGEIVGGEVWEDSIKRALHGADIILLLVSANSLASDYFYGKEVKEAMERHQAHTCTVIPVILKPCGWEDTELASLQALPKDGMAITLWENRDQAYKSVFDGLKVAIQKNQVKNKPTIVAQGSQSPVEAIPSPMPASTTDTPVRTRTTRKTVEKTVTTPVPEPITSSASSATNWFYIGGGILVFSLLLYFLLPKLVKKDRPEPDTPVFTPPTLLSAVSTIYPGKGFDEVVMGKTNLEDIKKSYPKDCSSIDHGTFSVEMTCPLKGISFYFDYKDYNAIKPDNKKYFTTISLTPPFKGKTPDGIVLGASKLSDVEKVYGALVFTTTQNGAYWMVEYSAQGIRFKVQKDVNVKPNNPEGKAYYRKQPIVGIDVFK
jgi:TIR domain